MMKKETQQKKCAHCLKELGDEARGTIQLPSGPADVHRQCTLVPELQAALDALDAISMPEDRYQAIKDQLARRISFFRDMEERAEKTRQVSENTDGGFLPENVVEVAARQSGYADPREWASETLLHEAQRIVFGPAAILASDWEGQCKAAQRGAAFLRTYMQATFAEALRHNKPDLPEQEVMQKAHAHVQSIESGAKKWEDTKLVKPVRRMPKGLKH